MAEEKRYRVTMKVLDADDLAYEGWPEGNLFDEAIELAEQHGCKVSDVYIPEGMDEPAIGVQYNDGVVMIHKVGKHFESTMSEMIWLFAK